MSTPKAAPKTPRTRRASSARPSTAIAPIPVRSEAQQAGIDEVARRCRAQGLRAPAFAADGHRAGRHPSEADEALFDARLALTTGCTDPRAQEAALTHLSRVLNANGHDVADSANMGAALLRELAPETPLQGLLASQMVATHAAAMTMLTRAVTSTQPSDLVDRITTRAVRLQRLFLEQIAALAKLQGHAAPPQRVAVEHLHKHVHMHGHVAAGARPGGAADDQLAAMESRAALAATHVSTETAGEDGGAGCRESGALPHAP